MKSEELRIELEQALVTIRTKSANERDDVIALVKDLIQRYNLLTRQDFIDDNAYERHLITKKIYIENQLLEKEFKWLSDKNDTSHILDNYRQTKLFIKSMLVRLS